MSTNLLANFEVVTAPSIKRDRDRAHLITASRCAITLGGWRRHISHQKTSHRFLGAAFTAPVLLATVGGGIGVVGALGAFGVGAAEQAVAGSVVGALAGNLLPTSTAGGGAQITSGIRFANLVGYVIRTKQRWFDQQGHDVLISWNGFNEDGKAITFESWHDPDEIYIVKAM